MNADPEVVEQLVARIVHSLSEAPDFSPCDGVSAAFTFTYRMCQTLVKQSTTAEAKKFNSQSISSTLRRIADQLDIEQLDPAHETVH